MMIEENVESALLNEARLNERINMLTRLTEARLNVEVSEEYLAALEKLENIE